MAGRNRLIRYSQLRGDPGFLGSLGKFVGKAIKTVAPALPGVGTAIKVAGIASTVSGIGKAAINRFKPAGAPAPMVPGLAAPPVFNVNRPATEQEKRMGRAAFEGAYIRSKRHRRMNALNPKAANRAIRRIKAVRKLVRRIESSLPKAKSSARVYSFSKARKRA